MNTNLHPFYLPEAKCTGIMQKKKKHKHKKMVQQSMRGPSSTSEK
jgi:hypothetical protein